MDTKNTTIEIGVDLFLMIVCAVFGIGLWGSLIGAMRWLIPLERPYLWAAGLMLLLNIGHYIWGLFHVEDDISDIPARGMMTSYWDFQRIAVRIAAFLTIGPSIYLRQAAELYRSRSTGQDS